MDVLVGGSAKLVTNKTLVIEDRKIIESGNHKELISMKGYYYNLYENQFIEDESRIVLG